MILDIPLKKGGGVQQPNVGVIHAMGEFIKHEGKVYHATAWLDFLGISVHGMICPSGDIIECRPDNKKAWHAKGHNDNTLGWEFLVRGVYSNVEDLIEVINKPYLTELQYKNGIDYIAAKRITYGIGIVKHSGLTSTKPDPGDGFPWEDFKYRTGG
jgi:N-acetyl-anhydromuramyl-L-alanine amidase AmpD